MTLRPICLAMIAVAIIGARPSAQRASTPEEITVSPYHLLHGQRDVVERVDRHQHLAEVADAAGDFARAARHYTLACQARSAFLRDASLNTPTCRRARELAKAHDILDVKVQMQVADGLVRAWSLDIAGAVSALREAVKMGAALNPDLPDHSAIIAAHHSLGTMLLQEGEFDAAQQEFLYARDHCRTAGNSVCAAYADIWLCRMHASVGDYGPARSACDAAQVEAAVDRDVMVVATLGWMRGNLEAALGHYEPSLNELMGAWKAAQVRGGEAMRPPMALLIIDALTKLGRLNDAETWQGNLERELASGRVSAPFGPSIAMRRGQLASARGHFAEAAPSFALASQSTVHEQSIRGHLALADIDRRLDRLPDARQSLERAIAKIEAGRSNISGSMLRAGYLTLHANAYRELIGVRWDMEGAAAAPAALEIAEGGRARALLDALGSAQVTGATAPTLTAGAVQQALAPDAVLIEYVSADNRLLAITVTRDRVAVTPLPGAGNAAELSKRVDFFASLVQENDEASLAPAAGRLYADLLEPALVGVPDSTHTLIIAADGPLHRLPFDALGAPAPVIERWDVVTVPSASILGREAHRDRPSDTALVVTAPATSTRLSQLPAAPEEAAVIKRRMRGEISELSGVAATKDKLQAEDLQRFAVLHFASHAIVDEERPLRSSLMLALEPSGIEGRWTAEEIYRTKLNADLVVLSACSTAAGAQSPGEGVMSLSRAFLYAGAGATIATLWDVPDAPGPVFADVLYRELAAGAPLGVAVADARRELRRQGAPPRAWAAYTVTGNPSARIGIEPQSISNFRTAGMTGVVALLLLIALVAVGTVRAKRVHAGR